MQSDRGGGAARPLEARIYDLFKEALGEGEFDAAEHLLQALEALAAKATDADRPARQRCLHEAYLAIGDRERPQGGRNRKGLN